MSDAVPSRASNRASSKEKVAPLSKLFSPRLSKASRPSLTPKAQRSSVFGELRRTLSGSMLQRQSQSSSANQEKQHQLVETKEGLVKSLKEAFEASICLLDEIEDKKLLSVRFGGELRGLLGKAQDEFLAYEDDFQQNQNEEGVSIALQNLAASMMQIEPIVQKLKSTNYFVNKKFKKEVLFAFQEINTMYMSLFMELSMAMAKHSGLELPLPTSRLIRDADMQTPKSAEEYCLEGHQYYFGHDRAQDKEKAFGAYKEAAALGSIDAMVCLGKMYLAGDGVEKDMKFAQDWLEDAVRHGSIESCYALGGLLLELAQHQDDQIKRQELHVMAAARLTHAAENGHRQAQYNLGSIYEDGRAGSKDLDKAMSWYRKAADKGHTRAESSLGRLLLEGDPAIRNSAHAIHFLQRAATKGDSRAQLYLGNVYRNGTGVSVDIDHAVAYYRKASEGGELEAKLQLAKVLVSAYANGPSIQIHSSEDRHEEALQLLLTAARGGLSEAYFCLGDVFDNGVFVSDKAAALGFYMKAASSTPCHVQAAVRAADIHYANLDKRKAHHFYSLAATANDPHALNALGLMYEDGEGCEHNFQRAAECFRQAADLHHAHAHFNLGCLYAHGKGVLRSKDAAQHHFLKAHELGYALAVPFLDASHA